MKLVLHGDCLAVLRQAEDNSVDALVTDPPAGIGFMGKDWDDDKGGRDEWVAWLTEVMRECLRVMKPGAHGLVWALPRTSHWTATALENAGFEIRDRVQHLFGTGFPKSLDVSKAIDKAAGAERERGPMKLGGERLLRLKDGARDGGETWGDEVNRNAYTSLPSPDAARQWAGWGTALKPACEDWWLVRKPLSEKTVAANVLRWGTGALNIDGGRIGTETMGGQTVRSSYTTEGGHFGGGKNRDKVFMAKEAVGRFPSHLILDEEAAAMLGEPARFFYVAKASKSEKNAGLEGREEQIVDDGRQTPIDNPFLRGKTGRKNTHPTVKSTALMRYLCRLITPPQGIVLDPFAGSGSTGVAAVQEGFQFVGIEREREYHEIATARLAAAAKGDSEAA